jgi:hypothetical protein
MDKILLTLSPDQLPHGETVGAGRTDFGTRRCAQRHAPGQLDTPQTGSSPDQSA